MNSTTFKNVSAGVSYLVLTAATVAAVVGSLRIQRQAMGVFPSTDDEETTAEAFEEVIKLLNDSQQS